MGITHCTTHRHGGQRNFLRLLLLSSNESCECNRRSLFLGIDLPLPYQKITQWISRKSIILIGAGFSAPPQYALPSFGDRPFINLAGNDQGDL
jgi:hypothetical protein